MHVQSATSLFTVCIRNPHADVMTVSTAHVAERSSGPRREDARLRTAGLDAFNLVKIVTLNPVSGWATSTIMIINKDNNEQ